MNLLQCFVSQTDARDGRLAQQGLGLGSVARTAFMVKQHHRKVVLTERMATLRGSLEVLPRLHVVAQEPRGTAPHQIRIPIREGQPARCFELGIAGARASQ